MPINPTVPINQRIMVEPQGPEVVLGHWEGIDIGGMGVMGIGGIEI
jgi:hypothetical protein